jgi:phosphatidylinositol 4-kinase
MKYVVRAGESRQIELLPRILSYMKHLPVYEWDDKGETAAKQPATSFV